MQSAVSSNSTKLFFVHFLDWKIQLQKIATKKTSLFPTDCQRTIKILETLWSEKADFICHDEIGLINKTRWEKFIYNDVDFQFATAKGRDEKNLERNNKKSNQIVSIP